MHACWKLARADSQFRPPDLELAICSKLGQWWTCIRLTLLNQWRASPGKLKILFWCCWSDWVPNFHLQFKVTLGCQSRTYNEDLQLWQRLHCHTKHHVGSRCQCGPHVKSCYRAEKVKGPRLESQRGQMHFVWIFGKISEKAVCDSCGIQALPWQLIWGSIVPRDICSTSCFARISVSTLQSIWCFPRADRQMQLIAVWHRNICGTCWTNCWFCLGCYTNDAGRSYCFRAVSQIISHSQPHFQTHFAFSEIAQKCTGSRQNCRTDCNRGQALCRSLF